MRRARVVSVSLGYWRGPDRASMLDYTRALIGRADHERPDLICLPEVFVKDSSGSLPEAEDLDGPTVSMMRDEAKRLGSWVCGSLHRRDDTGGPLDRLNTAVMIDRDGEILDTYDKCHTTIGETELDRVRPGSGSMVVETDFGRVGAAICFDIGWPGLWQQLADDGAELVVWPSAYDGGFPLRMFAWLHGYHVVSSVRSDLSSIIDPLARVLASSSKWDRLAVADVAMDTTVFHIDDQVDLLGRIRHRFGAGVTAVCLSEENVFSLASNDPERPMATLIAETGLEPLDRYLARSDATQAHHRSH